MTRAGPGRTGPETEARKLGTVQCMSEDTSRLAHPFGIDFGGSGIKGAPVDLRTGECLDTLGSEPHRLRTWLVTIAADGTVFISPGGSL